MTSPNTKRAVRVCYLCKVRKKACDKELPRCGYCIRRGLDCFYDDRIPATSGDIGQANAQGILTVAKRPTTLGEAVYLQVCHILRSTGRSILEISEQFFESFHHQFPIVSAIRFYENAVEAQCGSPPACFSILILAICLITLRPPEGVDVTIGPKDVYLTAKALFAQVQAVTHASTALLQAGILISTFEFASGLSEAAYVSIGICARMSQILGLNGVENRRDGAPSYSKSAIILLEERNIWWAVMILERVIISEVPGAKPITEYPGPETVLPSDLPSEQRSRSEWNDVIVLETPRLYELYARDIGSLGRLAQAVYFMDQILRVVNLQDDLASKLPELTRLDEELRIVLALLMDQNYCARGVGCQAIGTSFRSLFLLHEYILAQTGPEELDASVMEQKQISDAALNNAATMIADIARARLEEKKKYLDTIPLCFVYLSNVAIKHVQNSHCNLTGGFLESLAPLLELEYAFKSRWNI
ncbi:hypothetical protein NA57DRAFT_73242 [Rhizodiscina lignyota]|uniref:Zn(2)-C6 fungal-type domain-containing protein n=1 Tax=Rhizodiscina lignyota TaxID=1504668 RepID=A0A9P4M8L2_9PEZI|nr:hypothetical protein NA57DRAFT_73242 [Rhizodiscina lignyota]